MANVSKKARFSGLNIANGLLPKRYYFHMQLKIDFYIRSLQSGYVPECSI